MAFFNKLGDMAKNIGDRTGDAIETSRLNAKINSEKAAAGVEVQKIGEFYYEMFAQTGEAVPEIMEFCQAAKAHYDAADAAQAEIDRIKAENEAVKAAAAQPAVTQPTTVHYAEEKREVPAKQFCTSCGAETVPGMKFCSQCGAAQ